MRRLIRSDSNKGGTNSVGSQYTSRRSRTLRLGLERLEERRVLAGFVETFGGAGDEHQYETAIPGQCKYPMFSLVERIRQLLEKPVRGTRNRGQHDRIPPDRSPGHRPALTLLAHTHSQPKVCF